MLPPADLAIVVPCYNEEANIMRLFSEWDRVFSKLGVCADWLLVNDGSTDRTGILLEQLARECTHVRVFTRTNSGHGRACRFGYETALGGGYPWVLQVDGDGQCDPAHFREFWELRSEADCVFGGRKTRDDGLLRVWVSAGCRLVASVLAGTDLGDANVPYRLIRGPVLRAALEKIPVALNLQNVALTFVLKRTQRLRWRSVPIHFRARQQGTNSIHLPGILRMGLGLIRDLKQLRTG